MHMGVPWLVVKVPIHDHPGIDHGAEVFPHVISPLVTWDPKRDGELDLAGKLGVLAFFGGLYTVPEGATIQHPGGGIGRGQDLRQDDLGLGVAEGQAATNVAQGTTGAISSGRHDGTPVRVFRGCAADGLGVGVEHGTPDGRGCGGGTPLRGVGGRSLLTAHIPKECISAPSLRLGQNQTTMASDDVKC